MKRFECHRHTDVSGISGTGVVSQGVVFDNGKVVVTWLTDKKSTTTFDSLEDAVFIHGHGGKTEFVFLDGDKDTNDRMTSQVSLLQNARRRVVESRAARNDYERSLGDSYKFSDLPAGQQKEYSELAYRANEAQRTLMRLVDSFVLDYEPERMVREV